MSAARPRPAWWLQLAAAGLAAAAGLGPASASELNVEESGPVVLGETQAVTLRIRIEEPKDQEQERPLQLAANVGTFGPVTRIEPGLYRVVYTPPGTRFPQLALIAVWRETGPDAPIEFLRLPLLGKTRVGLKATPGAEVRVEVGGRQFGPVPVPKDGKVEVPVLVPPGVHEATVSARSPGGATSNRTIAVEVPPYNRLTMALVPHAIASDGKGWARLELYYDGGDGAPPPPDRVKLSASSGSAELTGASNGHYVFRYVPPPEARQEKVQFEAQIAGDQAAVAKAALGLRLLPPAQLIVRTTEGTIPADGRSTTTMTALVMDERGLALAGQPVEFSADVGAFAPAEDRGDGTYVGTYTSPNRYPPGGLVRIEVKVPSGGPDLKASVNYQLQSPPRPASVIAVLSRAPIPADGRSETVITLSLRDAAGQPLAGQQIFAVASQGTLAPVTESGDGRYETRYVAPGRLPAEEVFVRVVDSVGGFEQQIPLPLREAPGRLLVGARAGLIHDLSSRIGPRAALDLWAPFEAGGTNLAGGFTLGLGHFDQTVAGGGLSSESSATFVPVTARLAAEIYVARRTSVVAGGGLAAVFASMSTSLTGAESDGFGLGALGFAAAMHSLGPGQAFVELNYLWAPVDGGDFRLDPGGLGFELGYRLGVF